MSRIYLAVWIVVGLSAAPAQAQLAAPVKTMVLNKDVRLGTFTSASVPLPAGAAIVEVRDSMSDADASDPTNHMVLTVSASNDGVNWRAVIMEDWQGGTFIAKGTGLLTPQHIDFSFGLNAGVWDGYSFRVDADIQTKLTTGLSLTMK